MFYEDFTKYLKKEKENPPENIHYAHKVGDFITCYGKEYCVVKRGPWGYRCERGFGDGLSIIVLPLEEYIM